MDAVFNARVHSEVQTAELLVDRKVALVIPSYQRPYVWPSEDVLKLLDDIAAAFDAGEPHYYIGTVLTATQTPVKTDLVNCIYELVDGQQRSTTLMLLALAFKKLSPSSPLAEFAKIADEPRLQFAIRDQVQAMLRFWVGLTGSNEPGIDTIEQNPYLKHLYEAYRVTSERLSAIAKKRGEQYLEDLGLFIFRQVKWVNNTMPAGMDLNRLFATMNTSGVQLEQTDILKSLLLKKIAASEKPVYDAIWQACENLNDYFERNLKKLFPGADWQSLEYQQLSSYDTERFPLVEPSATVSDNGQVTLRGFTIAELANDEGPISGDASGKKGQKKTVGTGEGQNVYCRSIISFSLLLMHTYRIFQHQRGKDDIDTRLNDGYLIQCFARFTQNASPEAVKAFIECLWQVRYQFDRWVVKWVEQPDDDREYLRLAKVSRSKSDGKYSFSRTPGDPSDISQLQSVRYFTGERSAQNWLTPFLGRLIREVPTDSKTVGRLLEKIDNRLSLAGNTQKDASFTLLAGWDINARSIGSVCDEFLQPHGTSFEHYWFQKLEYILWRNRAQMDCFAYSGKEINSYRIVSRNSVEHVHPQHEEHGKSLGNQYLHCFGNLALLSPGENSSYSNQSVLKKRADFISKPGYDSLKLAHIFYDIQHQDDWDQVAIMKHQEAMVALIQAHYATAV